MCVERGREGQELRQRRMDEANGDTKENSFGVVLVLRLAEQPMVGNKSTNLSSMNNTIETTSLRLLHSPISTVTDCKLPTKE